ncbi:pancreatic secretory granule membrane major glycoprotein GP2-like [Synchiropus splendidus]|uniref:pancreatic secretory granule membrane major glycoprotein GP2-like n=1 Tax=Synchiropus splendidus TaxID=270530 RepID=UPI00237DE115|nr:pancreatic secretory granule membrane major glycoprotein GP2-like [Synchiropus splendidus]
MDLLPCHSYETKVQALCGDVLMREKTITVHTVPHGVSEIRFSFSDSIASWTPGTPDEPTLGFVYELSLENGPLLQRDHLEEAQLHLPSLEDGHTYVLDVWEECHAQWESERLHLCITKNESAQGIVSTADSPSLYREPVMEMDYSSMSLIMSVPWSLPVEFLDATSDPGAKFMRIIRSNMQKIMDHYDPPVHVEVASIEPLSDELDQTRIVFMSFDAANTESGFPLPAAQQLEYLMARHLGNITVSDGVIHWTGPDLCSSRRRCPRNSLCLNTLGSFACLCQQGYYDVSPVLQMKTPRTPVCHENGLFSQCLERMMIGGIAKPYLASYIGGEVDVKLNDGRCDMEESDIFFVFHTSRMSSKCGTERRVNKTHIEFQNTLTVTLTKTEVISRRDLKVVWQCVYPLHYVQNAHFNMAMQWLSPLSLVKFNSSLQLLVVMALYSDLAFSEMYRDMLQLEPEDTLFFQVALHTNNSFASDVRLQVDSCWATESSDPDDSDLGVFIQDGCPLDNTVHWINDNGLSQTSRFSMQMFHMPKMLPIYFHCLANICGHDEQCTKNCSSLQRRRRAVEHHSKRKVSALVSAGPLTVGAAKSGLNSSPWTVHTTMISIVIGLIGVLTLTVLSVITIKLILKY